MFMTAGTVIPLCRCKSKGCTVCDLCPTPAPLCVCPHRPPKKRRGEHGQWKFTLLRTLQRFDEPAIDFAVSVIFSPENVSFLAWGTKGIKIGGIRYEFPAIMRRRSRSVIFDSYLHQSTLRRPGQTTLSQASFYRTISAVTAGDATMKKAVDYVQGFLVNDAFDSLRYIIDKFCAEDRKALIPLIEYNAAYMKYGFDARVLHPDSPDCVLHNIVYGLNPASDREVTTSICEECKKIFNFYQCLKAMVVSNGVDTSAHCVIDDCCEKARLYFAHRLRVMNQQRTIREAIDGMRERCVARGHSDEALIILDFKMKLEPQYYRAKTVDHYGKRGMSWHGALVQYFEPDHPDDGSPPKAVGQRLYCDHLSANDNKQDREAVLSMIEAVLMRIRKDLPQVKNIVLQSDNAGCYQNMMLPLFLPYLASIHGIEITRFIHTETQDGKSILDAHFARSMQHLLAWVREGNNCVTPTQAVVALKNRGGLPNTIVELVTYDRAALKLLIKEAGDIEEKVRKILSRANDIHTEVSGSAPPGCQSDYRSCARFTLTFYEYSGIGDAIIVDIDPATGSVAARSPMVPTRDKNEDAVDEDEEPPSDVEDEDGDTNSDLGDDFDIGESAGAPDTIDPSFAVGPVSGVRVSTQGQIRQRSRRWRLITTPCATAVRGEPTARDVVSYAVRHALKLQRSGDLNVKDPRVLPTIDRDAKPLPNPPVSFGRGWAVRPKRGEMYGRRYAAEYQTDIEELFTRGVANKSNKIGPGRMREILRVRYPWRFDVPTENELRQEIAKLRARRPSGKKAQDDISLFFNAPLDEDDTTKPARALGEFRMIFEFNELSDQQIKARFSSIKSQRKKAQRQLSAQLDQAGHDGGAHDGAHGEHEQRQ